MIKVHSVWFGVRRVLATAAILVAWLFANGAHWDAMQVAAWSKMFADYSETMPVSQALRETFDPTKPCEMCVGIAKAQESAEKQMPSPEQRSAGKIVLVLHIVDEPVFANDPGEWTTGPLMASALRTDPVPLPPPRV